MIRFFRQGHTICPALLLFFLAACGKSPQQPEANAETLGRPGPPSTALKSGMGNSAPGLAQVAERVPSTFKFEKLLQVMGSKMTPALEAQIEKNGRNQPEMNGQMGEGWKTYVLGLQEDGALVLHTAGGYLNIFGYAYKTDHPDGGGQAEASFLKDFQQTGTLKAEVLNASFDTVTMPVKKYVHNTQPGIQAVSYVHGGNHTLAFFDATRVHVAKMLPAPPDAMGKETVEEMKALLRARETIKP